MQENDTAKLTPTSTFTGDNKVSLSNDLITVISPLK